MNEPLLMPFQTAPFNGDGFIEQEFISLRDRFGLTTAVETGTCLGYTTLWLSRNFEKVYTIELNKEYVEIARAKFLQYPNITSIHGNSGDVLGSLKLTDRTLFFLDAHWGNQFPLLKELFAIYKLQIMPVIAIHDFFVPGQELGFDTYKGQPFNLSLIERQLRQIYGSKNNYKVKYNSEDKSDGAKRGIIYIYPNLVA